MHNTKCPGPFRSVVPLILASASPRRQEMLKSMGLGFQVVPALEPEPLCLSGEGPAEYAMRVARNKVQEVAKRVSPSAALLAADTIVVWHGEIFGKPNSPEHAFSMLSRLIGDTHQVITGCCVLEPSSARIEVFFVVSEVRMGVFSHEILRRYIDTGEPMDKAGAYAVQGCGMFLVQEIRGSFSNVIGLPLTETVDCLLKLGIIEVCR